MKKNVIIVILIIIILGLSGYFIYDKIIDKDKKNMDKFETSQEKTEKDDNKTSVEVIDFINYSIDKTNHPGLEYLDPTCGPSSVETIRIPMLNSNKKGATELNNKIKEDLKTYIDASKKSKEDALNSVVGFTANYSYEEYKNYISIKISASSYRYCGSGAGQGNYYTYDKTNDKYLSNPELLNLANVTIDEIINRVKLDITSFNYPEEQTNEKIELAINVLNDNSYGAYINYVGNLIIEINYDYHISPLIYTYHIPE